MDKANSKVCGSVTKNDVRGSTRTSKPGVSKAQHRATNARIDRLVEKLRRHNQQLLEIFVLVTKLVDIIDDPASMPIIPDYVVQNKETQS